MTLSTFLPGSDQRRSSFQWLALATFVVWVGIFYLAACLVLGVFREAWQPEGWTPTGRAAESWTPTVRRFPLRLSMFDLAIAGGDNTGLGNVARMDSLQ